MSSDIDSGCKTHLKHLRYPFPAISRNMVNGGDIYVYCNFFAIFWNDPISEVSNIPQTSKIYSQIAEMFLYKIQEFGDDIMIFSNFLWGLQKIVWRRSPKMSPFEECLKSMKIGQNSKKNRFFQNELVFYHEYHKWKDPTWLGCFAPKRVWTLLLRRRWKIDF